MCVLQFGTEQQPSAEIQCSKNESKTPFRDHKSVLKGVWFNWIQRVSLVVPFVPEVHKNVHYYMILSDRHGKIN